MLFIRALITDSLFPVRLSLIGRVWSLSSSSEELSVFVEESTPALLCSHDARDVSAEVSFVDVSLADIPSVDVTSAALFSSAMSPN